MVLEVDLELQRGEGSARNHVEEMKAALMSENCRLRKMDLDSSDLDDEAGKAIGEALKVNSSIKEISLKINKLGDEAGKAIGEALKVNTSIETIE